MLDYIWPIVLIIVTNTIYQICSKSIPSDASPFASLTVTYLVAAAMTAVLHFFLRPGEELLRQFVRLNWAPYVLGIVIVGLEVGWIFAYKAGWQVSTGFIVQSAFMAVTLIFVGAMLYKEPITWNKIVGIVICLIGLVFIKM